MIIGNKEVELFEDDETTISLCQKYFVIKGNLPERKIMKDFRVQPYMIVRDMQARYSIKMSLEEAAELIDYAENVYPLEIPNENEYKKMSKWT